MMDYEEQLSAAKFRAERDQARQEVKELREELDAASKDAAERSKILEAARWVRDHGGLAHVMDIVHDFRAVVERIGVEWSESELHAIMDVLDSRLMPEGMAWPRYDSGEQVRIGETMFSERDGKPHKIARIAMMNSTYLMQDMLGDTIYQGVHGIQVKRPAVIAADGEPLEVGQTVWDTTKGKERTVIGFDRGKGEFFVKLHGFDPGYDYMRPTDLTHHRPVLDADGVEVHKGDEVWSTTGEFDGKRTVSSVHIDPDEPPYATFEERQKPYSCLCCYLIHRAPVIAADGKPLREGETVYLTDSTTAFVVDDIMTREDGATVVHLAGGAWHRPQDLTHKSPDSWERIEADCMQDAKDYCEEHGIEPEYPKHIGKAKCEDLVRRCRALAERERGE